MDSILHIVQSSKIMREWLNGGLFPLNLSLVIVLGLFIWDTFQEHGRDWAAAEGAKTACALWWIFLADGIRACLVWLLLRVEVGALPPFDLHHHISPDTINWGFAFAGIIGVCASLRCIYLFTPPRWGHCYWIASALSTAAWLVFTHQGA